MKRIAFHTHKDDVGYILKHVLARAVSRHRIAIESSFNDAVSLIDQNDSTKVQEIFNHVSNMYNLTEDLKKDLTASSEILNYMIEEKSPTDTEVVEDLPDLEEDGLGVDNGSI
jgi:hypothetical protein